jgi:DNA-binding SARP family transcriptional activator
MAHLSLSLLGPFQVTLDRQPVTGFKSNKVRALLAYLAVEADRPHHREVLAGLLWPDWSDRDALSNLRYALSNLRRVIGDRAQAGGRDAEPPFLLVARDTLQFNTASDHSLDVAVFTDLTGRQDLSHRFPYSFSGGPELASIL